MRKEECAAFRSLHSIRARPKPRCKIPSFMVYWPSAMQSAAEEPANGILQSNSCKKKSMPDPNLPLLEDAVFAFTPLDDPFSAELAYLCQVGLDERPRSGRH